MLAVKDCNQLFVESKISSTVSLIILFSSKIQNYSPTEAAKVYDKPLQRKSLVRFNPETVLHVLREKNQGAEKSFAEDCDKLIDDYLNVSIN